MMTSSNGNIFRVTRHLCGEFRAQRPVTRRFDVFFDLRLNKRLRKQSWGWWFEKLSCPLWRYCNGWPSSQRTMRAFQSKMTSWHWNTFRIIGPLQRESTVGGFPHIMPVMRTFGVSFVVNLDNRVGQSSFWWFETLWRSCDITISE